MFCHPDWAVGDHSSGPAGAGTLRTKATGGFTEQICHPVVELLPGRVFPGCESSLWRGGSGTTRGSPGVQFNRHLEFI